VSIKGPSGLALLQSEVEAIREGRLAPVYVVAGDEPYYSDRIQRELLQHVPEDTKDFNLDVLYGSETRIQHVVSAARAYPMMADRRMVVVREFRLLFDKQYAQSENLAADTALFVNYLSQPNPQTVLVLVDTALPPGNTTLGAALRKSPGGRFLSFEPVPESELQDWISQAAMWTCGLEMEPEAARLMAQRMGPHLDQLSKELDKLCTQNRTTKTIRIDEIREKIPLTREYDVFELKDAVLRRDLDRAFHIAERLLQQADSDVGEVVKSVSFFHTVFSNLWTYQRLTAKGLPPAEIQKILNMKGAFYFLQKDAAVFRPRQWGGVFEAIHDADRAVKGMSRLEPPIILMMMLKRIMTA
jgi:DNA polymerase-3 subunit delta